MVAGTDPNVFHNNSANSQNYIGNINLSDPHSLNKAFSYKHSDSRPVRNLSATTAASVHDVSYLNSLFPGSHERSDDLLVNKIREFQIYTLMGLVLLILLTVWSALRIEFLKSLLFFAATVALSLCCLYGCKLRDWRFVFGAVVISLGLSAYSVSECFQAALLMIKSSKMTDSDIIDEGYFNRTMLIALSCLKCTSSIFAALFWAAIAYFNQSLIQVILRGGCIRNRQQLPHTQDTLTTNAGHDVGRDLSLAETSVSFDIPSYATTSRSVVSSSLPLRTTNSSLGGAAPTAQFPMSSKDQEAKQSESQILTFDRVPPAYGFMEK